jgi:hypothetical protein
VKKAVLQQVEVGEWVLRKCTLKRTANQQLRKEKTRIKDMQNIMGQLSIPHSNTGHLYGLVVSVLATGPKGSRVEPRPRATDADGDKSPQYALLRGGGEVSPSASCHKILRHVKEPFEV